MWWKTILMVIGGLVVAIVVALLYGNSRWNARTKQLRGKLEVSRLRSLITTYDARELEGLPPPVARYFRAALADSQRMIEAVTVEHAGTFNMSETAEEWKPFASTQRIVTYRPGFLWEARVAMRPGLAVRAYDAYIGGEGILHVSLFGLVTLVNLRGRPEVTEGELMRFLAEAPWYPTALLPSRGVRWEAVDDTSAKATLTGGETGVTMLFRFNGDGLIESVRAEARGRTVGGAVVPTPWEGRWSHYEMRDGMRIPLEGEVAWMLPEGPKPYWRGRITSLKYEFAR
jgi:hypothetical protein